jgi:hypothetical protein
VVVDNTSDGIDSQSGTSKFSNDQAFITGLVVSSGTVVPLF